MTNRELIEHYKAKGMIKVAPASGLSPEAIKKRISRLSRTSAPHGTTQLAEPSRVVVEGGISSYGRYVIGPKQAQAKGYTLPQ